VHKVGSIYRMNICLSLGSRDVVKKGDVVLIIDRNRYRKYFTAVHAKTGEKLILYDKWVSPI